MSSSHYSGGGSGGGGGGASTSGSYYSRSSSTRDSERGGRDRDRGREWRRERDSRARSRDRERDKDKEKERPQRSPSPPPPREKRFSEYSGGGGGSGSTSSGRDRDRRPERYAGKSRYGGTKHGRFGDRSSTPPPPPSTSSVSSSTAAVLPNVPTTALIREKDLNAAKLLGYGGGHYGPSYHYASDGYFPTEPVKKVELKSKDKDPKNNPLFREAVNAIIMNIKTKGDYDQIRKECFSDIDTKAAYINLHSRIKSTVDKYLNQQTYKKDMDKVKVREGMRKKILDTPYFEKGIESVVSQIVVPKIKSLIRPKVEEEVYKYLNAKKAGVPQIITPANTEPEKKEEESEFQHVIATKEFSFHDITSAVMERKKKSTTPPPKKKRGSDDEEFGSSEEDEVSSRSGSESSDGVMTPEYSPAGKTPMASEDEADDDDNYGKPLANEEESKGSGSLQIDESAETNKSDEVEDSVEMSDVEQSARTPTPTLPPGSISPIVPRGEGGGANSHESPDEAAFVPVSSAYIVQDHLAQLTVSQARSPTTRSSEPSMEVPSPLNPDPGSIPLPPGDSSDSMPPLPPSSPLASHFPHPPPPACDDTACSSPPAPDGQRKELLPFSTAVPADEPPDGSGSDEPLPPGEEPEGYFTQMRQKMEEMRVKDVVSSPSPAPLQIAADEENVEEEEEEVEYESEEESPMFEKVGEVSPPRVVELHNSELAQELTKELLGHAVKNDEELSRLTGISEEGSKDKQSLDYPTKKESTVEIKPDFPPQIEEPDSDPQEKLEESTLRPNSPIPEEGNQNDELATSEHFQDQSKNNIAPISSSPPQLDEDDSNPICKFLEPLPNNFDDKLSFYKRLPLDIPADVTVTDVTKTLGNVAIGKKT